MTGRGRRLSLGRIRRRIGGRRIGRRRRRGRRRGCGILLTRRRIGGRRARRGLGESGSRDRDCSGGSQQ
ncbi:hypothetical protein BF49_4662 [Bradyrhizobium sp.]|nr:hypothetical protein BF49_4662 [Bradyrhizobium sp.]